MTRPPPNELERHTVVSVLLARWARVHVGPEAVVDEVERLPGHSGITWAFRVRVDHSLCERLVLKVPPLGVRQRESTDVLRQVEVLRLVAQHGVRVPRLRSWGPATADLPVPYLVVTHLPGHTLGDVFAEPLPACSKQVADCFDQAVAELARIHQVDTGGLPRGWSPVRDPRDEVDRWLPLLRRAEDESWCRQGQRVRDRLVAHLPGSAHTGLVHGDFYSNNWLFDAGALSGVLDWEASGIGPQELDVAWLCMMYDPECWGPTRRTWMTTGPTPDWLLERYEHHRGAMVVEPDWFRALACFRLACLTAHYLRLHRTGRRRDPVWELFGEAFGCLLTRAETLLSR